ncbi:MAG TPA: dolichyl-phosphate beta-glucosyltransferase [Dehalococcoidia bacterium]|nr:dolichyl-phosphate beta-glucosyltransferase [Dehalococcoidia bacterium]
MTSVDVVIPVYNEERALPQTVPRLRDFLSEPAFSYTWRIVIADNASLDRTPEVGRRLADEYGDEVEYVRIEQKGRGRALRQTWLESPMDILSYMDVDLSTELEAFPALISAIAGDGYDIAIGSRLARGARVTRSFSRTALSRGYNAIIKAVFRTRFSDAQCGFKAVSRPVAQELIPLTEDNNWFFDTELLIIAEKLGYRIKDVPVAWIEDPDTRVNVSRTVSEDLRGLWRLRRTRPWLSPSAPRPHPG